MAMPVRNGVSSYSSALFARPDAALPTMWDLKQARAAWVDRQSASGYALIRAWLRASGVDLDVAFASETFVGSHDAVTRAVLEGAADVGATFVYFEPEGSELQSQIRNAGWGSAEVSIVTQVGPIPCDVLACSKRVPPHVSIAVQTALIESDDAELSQAAQALFEAEAFAPCTEAHFESLGLLLDVIEGGLPPMSLRPPPAR
jgi:phosphonate transport system substrate-binding protein